MTKTAVNAQFSLYWIIDPRNGYDATGQECALPRDNRFHFDWVDPGAQQRPTLHTVWIDSEFTAIDETETAQPLDLLMTGPSRDDQTCRCTLAGREYPVITAPGDQTSLEHAAGDDGLVAIQGLDTNVICICEWADDFRDPSSGYALPAVQLSG
ncbi:MAG: hypothetical protein NZM00_07660, partial [Anaerolinea sp.]|nr:hypothetical protein [Anaerolinea sp.]